MAAGIAAYAALVLFAPDDGGWGTAVAWAYPALFVLCAAGLALRLAVVAERRGVWVPLLVGLAASAGGWSYSIFVLSDDAGAAYPSVADGLWLTYYASMCLTVVLIGRSASRGRGGRVWLDAAIVSSAAAAVVVAVVFPFALGETSGEFAAVATNIAYPAADALAVALVAGLLGLRPSGFDRRWLYVIAGVTLIGAADAVYFWQATHGTYAFGTHLDLAWPIANSLLVLAAWERPPPAKEQGASLAVPVAAGCVAVLLGVWGHFDQLHVVATVLFALSLTLALLRLVLTVRENVALARLLEEAIEERERTHWHLKKVREVLSVCIDCDTIRTGDDEWVGAVEYLKQNDLLLSHGYCPDCQERHERSLNETLA